MPLPKNPLVLYAGSDDMIYNARCETNQESYGHSAQSSKIGHGLSRFIKPDIILGEDIVRQ